MPGEFLAVDVGGCGCAVAAEFHAVGCDVFFFFSEEVGVSWGMGRKKAAKMPKTMVMAPSTKNMNGLGFQSRPSWLQMSYLPAIITRSSDLG